MYVCMYASLFQRSICDWNKNVMGRTGNQKVEKFEKLKSILEGEKRMWGARAGDAMSR